MAAYRGAHPAVHLLVRLCNVSCRRVTDRVIDTHSAVLLQGSIMCWDLDIAGC